MNLFKFFLVLVGIFDASSFRLRPSQTPIRLAITPKQDAIAMFTATLRSHSGGGEPPMLPPSNKLPESSLCRNSNECDANLYCCAIFISKNIPVSGHLGYCCNDRLKALENYIEP